MYWVRIAGYCLNFSLKGYTSKSDTEMQCLANYLCDGNIEALANRIHDFAVSSKLLRLVNYFAVFDVQDEIPAEYVIIVMTNENVLKQITVN